MVKMHKERTSIVATSQKWSVLGRVQGFETKKENRGKKQWLDPKLRSQGAMDKRSEKKVGCFQGGKGRGREKNH